VCWGAYHFKNTYSPITLGNISSINLVSIFRCSSSPSNPVYQVCSMFFRRQSTQRLPSAYKVTHEARHLATQLNTPFHPYHIIRLGVSWIEFQFCCLRTRFVSQGVFCFHSAGFGGSWTFTVIFLNVSRSSTLFVSLYISLT
jgi:hypothetical protein